MTDVEEREPLDLDAAALALQAAVEEVHAAQDGRPINLIKVVAALDFMPDMVEELGQRRAIVAELEEGPTTYEYVVAFGGRQKPDACDRILSFESWEKAQIVAGETRWRAKPWRRRVSTTSLAHPWEDGSALAF